MSLLRKVLAGIGSYLVKEHDRQEQFDMQAARDQLLFDRDVALKGIEHGYHEQEGETALGRAKELDTTQTANAMVRDEKQAGYKVAADTASDARDLSKAITLKKLDIAGDVTVAGLQHKYKISEAQAQSALDLNRSLTEAGQTVDRIVFTKDGRGVAYSKTAKKLGETAAGTFNPSGSDGEGSGLGDYLNSGGASSGSSISRTTAQPKMPSQDQSRQRAAALAALGTAYAEASQNPSSVRTKYPALFDASGNLRPKDELIGQVNARYGAQ